MYHCLNGVVPAIFNDLTPPVTENMHGRDTHNTCNLHVPNGSLDIRRPSMTIHEANSSNLIAEDAMMTECINVFKQRLHNFILDRNNIH